MSSRGVANWLPVEAASWVELPVWKRHSKTKPKTKTTQGRATLLRMLFVCLQIHGLRRLMQGDSKHPKAPLGNNFRQTQPLHFRPVRTNIDFKANQVRRLKNHKPNAFINLETS